MQEMRRVNPRDRHRARLVSQALPRRIEHDRLVAMEATSRDAKTTEERQGARQQIGPAAAGP
jgi:hypothetical protein